MLIDKLRIENFRCFEKIEIDFGSRVNLFIGENGKGKSAILDAVAIALGAISTHLPNISGVSFKSGDLRIKRGREEPYSFISLKTDNGLEWDRLKRRDKSKASDLFTPQGKGLRELDRYLDEFIIDKSNNKEYFTLPIYAFYGVSRAILDAPLRRKGFKKIYTRFDALNDSLNAVSRFKSAFMWFYEKEFEESKYQKEKKDFDIELKELKVIRKAISLMFPDITNPHIAVNPLRFMLNKDSIQLSIDQLSDGYKTMFGLIIDMVSRFVMANPDMENPLEAQAVILIDEIDLHLHPAWQERIVGDLLRTFPNTQFILTTHSPYIVESLNNHLKRGLLNNLNIADTEILNVISLTKEQSKAYLLDNGLSSILDNETGLIDDKLLANFNKINILYDKMRDIEWDAING